MDQLSITDISNVPEEINNIISGKIDLICGRRGAKAMTKLSAKAVTKTGKQELLVLLHPHEPTCTSPTCTFYYHIKGQPLRCFECTRVKKVEQFILS